MIIYQNSTTEFIHHVLENKIADMMKDTFKEQVGRSVNAAEYASWQNSSQHVKNIVELAELKDNMIVLEYEVPYNTSRIDCLIFGRGENSKSYVVLIELKQWTNVTALEDDGNFVETYTGGNTRVVSHPCQQVEGYHNHMLAFVEVFEVDEGYDLFSCAYCHNYTRKENDGLHSPIYKSILNKHPLYSKNDVFKLGSQLKKLLQRGDGLEIFNRFMQSRIRPSRKLLEHTAGMINGEQAFSLLNEQLVAKNLIMSKIKKAERQKTKSIIVIQGGPGTGKSVIALHILAELAGRNKKVLFGCKSKPFVTALKDKVGKKASALFSNLYRFIPTKIGENELDAVLVDEAHRIERTSNFRYTSKEHRTDMTQIEQLIRCAKTAVFFIDDKQNVRAQEIGNTQLMRECAKKYGSSFDIVELVSQFRCNGSNGYLDWLESTLGYLHEKRILSKSDDFDFRIFDSPKALFEFIRQKEEEKENSARLVAGYCWPWSDPTTKGMLVNDVVINDFAMPWEAKEGKKLQKGIPRWFQWAFKTAAVNQIGCIYTAQGFEFDYIGVIVGDDLVCDSSGDQLVGNISASCDPTLRRDSANFDKYVRNIYRVLMSRGMKGCYVYFLNKETERFFRSRMDLRIQTEEDGATKYDELVNNDVLPFRHISPPEARPFENCVPLYDLKIAASGFSGEQEIEDFEWVELSDAFRPNRNLFVAQVVGESMNRRIPNGSWCLFRFNPAGSRQGKVVLVQHREIQDTDTGGHFTVKVYESEKRKEADGTWQHTKIILRPDSTDSGYQPITFTLDQAERLQVIAELVAVLT